MTNKISNDPFAPWDQDAHSREMCDEKTDVFNRLCDDVIPTRGGLRQKLAELVATNPEAQQAVLESGGSLPTVAKNFHLSSGETGVIVCDTKGLWRATITVAGEPLSFTSESRDEAMLLAENYMAERRGPRELIPQEELLVKRLALGGESANAAELYVSLRLSNMKRRSAQEILTDPSLIGVLNDGARFVWSCTRPDYIPSPAFDQLLDRVSATRPLTINSVDALYDLFTDEKAAAARSTRPAAPVAAPESERQPAPRVAPSQAEVSDALEHMSDEKIDQLRNEALRHRGRLIRRFDEKILAC